MNYSKLIKTVDSIKQYKKKLITSKLNAQYNPDRFKLWKSLHTGPENKVLHMLHSPHYKFLKDNNDNIKTSAYYQMHKLYGRNHKWIIQKIHKFIDLKDNIIKNGYRGGVIILNKPLESNPYNNSYEIFEGHHRVAILLYLNKETMICNLKMWS